MGIRILASVVTTIGAVLAWARFGFWTVPTIVTCFICLLAVLVAISFKFWRGPICRERFPFL